MAYGTLARVALFMVQVTFTASAHAFFEPAWGPRSGVPLETILRSTDRASYLILFELLQMPKHQLTSEWRP